MCPFWLQHVLCLHQLHIQGRQPGVLRLRQSSRYRIFKRPDLRSIWFQWFLEVRLRRWSTDLHDRCRRRHSFCPLILIDENPHEHDADRVFLQSKMIIIMNTDQSSKMIYRYLGCVQYTYDVSMSKYKQP